ncbi:MAG: LysM peptidoglycan-binding domain-containing protein, partial [bacterium]|nr:LysM peptidoglycan-binding domain-containing protein [bacterium]
EARIAAEAAVSSAEAERDAALAALAAFDAASAESDTLRADLEAVNLERDALDAALDAALAAAVTERDALIAERDALTTERDALTASLALTEARGETALIWLDETVGALEDTQGRAARLTDQLSALLTEQAGLQEITQAQRDQLAAVRTALEEVQVEVARLTGARGIYTVQDVDSLSSIAQFFYRDGNRWPDILAANANLIGDPDLIFAGMVLIVP